MAREGRTDARQCDHLPSTVAATVAAITTKTPMNTVAAIFWPVDAGNVMWVPAQNGHTDFLGTGVQPWDGLTRGGPVMIRGTIFL